MMGADNRGALRAMRRTKGALGQHLVDHFHEQVDIMQQRHPRARMVLRWTLRHVGMAENERADAEAKRAARGESSLGDQLPRSCKRKIQKSKLAEIQWNHKEVKTEAATFLAKSPRYLQLCVIDLTVLSPKFGKDMLGLSRGRASMITQLRMGCAWQRRLLEGRLHWGCLLNQDILVESKGL